MRKSNNSACQLCLLQTLEMAAEEQRKQTQNDDGLDIAHVQQLKWGQTAFQMGPDCLSDGSKLILDGGRLPFRQEQVAFCTGARLPVNQEQIALQTTFKVLL